MFKLISFAIIMALPACFGVIAIGLAAYGYFMASGRNPSIIDSITEKLFVIMAIIEASVLACLGIGYSLMTSEIEYDRSQEVEKYTSSNEQLVNVKSENNIIKKSK